VHRLALARAISFAGSTSAFIALAAVVYAKTGSAVWPAAAALASFATPALLSPFAGLIGDRYDRRTVMICSDLLGALCFAAMALLSAPGALVGTKVLASALAAPLIPASGAALPAVSAPKDLAWANSRLAIAGTVGSLVGPLAGGLLVAGASGSLVFALNAVTFVISAALVFSIRARLRPEPGERRRRNGPGVGFAFLVRNPELRRVTVAFAVIFLGIGITLPAEIALAAGFGVGASGYGALVALWAAGGLIGARIGGRIERGRHARALLTVAAGGMAIAFFATGGAPLFALALLSMAVGGACEGVWQVAQQFLLQSKAPDAIRSRVLAANEAIAQGGFAGSLLFAGFLVDWLGPRAVFYLAGGACLFGTMALLGRLRGKPRSEGELSPAVELPLAGRR
jgi:MFS family permease